jgi:hypothetical protein
MALTEQNNRTEQNRTEQNRTEQNRTEQNRTEQNRTDKISWATIINVNFTVQWCETTTESQL